MKAVQTIPGSPNSVTCTSLGCYDSALMLAYGCGKSIVLVQAHTFNILQILQLHTDEVKAVSWARTGGRLASSSLNSVVISVPDKSSQWQALTSIKPEGQPTYLSWSFFGDLLLVVSDHMSLWNFETSHKGEILSQSKPIWLSKTRPEFGLISPDGRLIAAGKESRVNIYFREGDLPEEGGSFNTDALKFIRLDNKSRVEWCDWKDISTFKLYLNQYNPNSLLTVTKNGWVRVWSEYSYLGNIGFNIVFQLQTNNGLAAWVKNFPAFENHSSVLAQKHEVLKNTYGEIKFTMKSKSCIIRNERTEPEQPLYGASIKERIPVGWFVIIQPQSVVFYMCEGLGAYPITSIAISHFVEYSEFWSQEALRWVPVQMPLYILKEEDEVQILGVDETNDLVRWRSRPDQEEYGGYNSALTCILGGHLGSIVQIECHDTLPLVCTLDNLGTARIWNVTPAVEGDTGAVNSLRHWGVLEDHDYSFVIWVKHFAILVCGRVNGTVCLYKWKSETANKLRLPSMHWDVCVCWPGLDDKCMKLDAGSIEESENEINFKLLGVFENQGWILWNVNYDKTRFKTDLVYTENGIFTDAGIKSYPVFSEEDTEESFNHSIYAVSRDSLKAYEVSQSGIQLLWEKPLVPDVYSMKLSSLISLTRATKSQVVYYTFDGHLIESLSSAQPGSLLSCFLGKGLVAENMVCAQGNIMKIMAQEFLDSPGEEEMNWKQMLQVPLESPAECIGVTIFSQVLVASGGTFYVYSSDEMNIFRELTTMQVPKAYCDPNFLLELMIIGKDTMVEQLLKALDREISKGKVSLYLGTPLSLFFEQSEPSTQVKSTDWFFDSAPSSGTSVSEIYEIKKKVEEISVDIQGPFHDLNMLRRLVLVIDCFANLKMQERAFDEFMRVFYLFIREFKLISESRAKNKKTCLNTMEVAWALHSDQQDTILQLLGDMDWNAMKAYGVGIWLTSSPKLKILIEKLIKADYSQNRDPVAVTLWYLILGKKNILLALYKADESNRRIYHFLVNDFSKEEWQVKAMKNAFELRKQRRFVLSAAFFVLASRTAEALEVVVQDLGDPQLALVICRMLEPSALPGIIEKYFLKTALQAKDPWLLSISYTLLEDHAKSLTCFLEFPSDRLTTAQHWKPQSAPALSGFHPSMFHFVNLLKKKIYVRRCIEDVADLDAITAVRSAKAFLKAGLPTLALEAVHKRVYDSQLLEQILTTYLLGVIVDTAHSEWTDKFPTLSSEISYLSKQFKFPKMTLLDFVGQIFYKQGFRHYECSLWAGVEMTDKGREAALHTTSIIHILISRFSRDPYFESNTEMILGICKLLELCISILSNDEEKLKGQVQLFQITFGVYLGHFLISYINGCWGQLMDILGLLQQFFEDFSFRSFVECKNDSNQLPNDLVNVWLKYLAVSKLLDLMERSSFNVIDEWFEISLMKFNLLDLNSEFYPEGKEIAPLKAIEQSLGPGRGVKKRPLMTVNRLKRRIISWKRRLLIKAQMIMSNKTLRDTQKYLDIFTSPNPHFHEEISRHFPSLQEFQRYNQCMDNNKHVHLLLQSSGKSLSTFIYETPGRAGEIEDSSKFMYEESMKENATLFSHGIEVFKGKEGLLGFAVNNSTKTHLAIITSARKYKIKEVSIEKSLKFKSRNSNFDLEHEYLDQWEDSYVIPQENNSIMSPAINAALHTLYTPQKTIFREEQKLPPKTWHRMPLSMLLSSLSSNKYRTERAEIIQGHPLLPLYVTGNESGILTLWEYEKENSLNDFVTPVTSSKVSWLEFSSYGDKLGACDDSGNFFLYKFDLQPTSFHPQLTMVGSIQGKASAFTFLNLGSVIATVGHKPKSFLCIYDTLLPPNESLLHTESTGGRFVHYMSRYQQLIICDKKSMVRYDLRMQRTLDSEKKAHDLIVDVKSDPTQTTIVSAGTDGTVKIWDARDFSLRESIELGRKSVSQIQFVDNVLFAATSDGGVRLLRTTTH